MAGTRHLPVPGMWRGRDTCQYGACGGDATPASTGHVASTRHLPVRDMWRGRDTCQYGTCGVDATFASTGHVAGTRHLPVRVMWRRRDTCQYGACGGGATYTKKSQVTFFILLSHTKISLHNNSSTRVHIGLYKVHGWHFIYIFCVIHYNSSMTNHCVVFFSQNAQN